MKTLIYGAGATGRMAAFMLKGSNQEYELVDDMADDLPFFEIYEKQVYSLSDALTHLPFDEYEALVCVGYQHGKGGMNARREELSRHLLDLGYALRGLSVTSDKLSMAHARCSKSMILGGTEFHTNVILEPGCFLGSNVTVGHDVRIGAYSWINSGVSIDGSAKIGRRCVIGSNAVVGAGVTLGDRTLVGPGAVVLRDTAPDAVVLAAPSEVQRFSSDVYGGMAK